jgi:predicted lipid-binding transport protein (Tim44 family)
MKSSFALFAAVIAVGFTLATGDADAAKRLGGGRSSGMQREASTSQAAPAAKPQAATAAPAAPGAAAQPKRSWMGPLAGLAAGLGLAALASHFGFGEGLANMLLIGLAVMAVMVVVGMFMRRRAAAQQPAMAGAGGMQYADAGADFGRANDAAAPLPQGSSASLAPLAAPARNVPADFDVEGFVRNAKVSFIRLQAANDACNLDDIREFTTPEMFGEIKLSFVERGTATQQTEVVTVNAEVIDVAEESARYVVSVRFQGLMSESKAAPPEPFDEVWHMVKPRDGSRGWVLAGIQQAQ